MDLVYIHGAGASVESFNYIREHIPHHKEILLEYNVSNGYEKNLVSMAKKLQNSERVFFIAHSMGGLYAVHLANKYQQKTAGAVTMSTPYGGVAFVNYTKYFLPFNKLVRDIASNSIFIKETNEIPVTKPWCNIVTTRGTSPLIIEPNDGVVTVKSQKHRKDMELKEVQLNHYEVVISPKTVSIINNKIANSAET